MDQASNPPSRRRAGARAALRAAAALVLALPPAGLALAQGNSDIGGPKTQQQNPCQADVFKFEQSMALVRQGHGPKAAAELREKLLPSKLENEILLKDGYCGLARYLKDKKLI